MATSGKLSSHKKGLYKVYYDEFQEFIQDVFAQELENHRQSSREVLKTMLEPGFSELVTDLYEEVLRRKATGQENINGMPFYRLMYAPPSQTRAIPSATPPTLHKEYHPKRNETRIKLASAPVSKIKSLVSDVYHELNRRFPEFKTLTLRPRA